MIANEWLDNVPCELVELDEDGVPRYLPADLSLGDVVEGNDLRGWRSSGGRREPGDRAEIGLTRDRAWAEVLEPVADGAVAVAIDYGHVRADRPPTGH